MTDYSLLNLEFILICRVAKQEALALSAAKTSKSATKIIVPGTPKPGARVGQTPRRRAGI